MKAGQMVDTITDAITDALREALPRLIADEVEARLAAAIAPALSKIEGEQQAVRERLTAFQVDFATRGTAQSDALTTSWQRQVDALRSIIAESVDARIDGRLQATLDAIEADVKRIELDTAALDELCGNFDTRLGALRTDFLAAGIQRAAEMTHEVRTLMGEALKELTPVPGPPGPPGRNGRDATFTAPVHYKAGSIYERGAIVQHRGGLWHANVDTDAEPGEPCSGYGLVLDGCEPLRVEAWGEAGELALVYRFASGVTKSIPLGFRPMQHVGIYDHGRAYLVNDCVTCDGSVWLARAASTEVKPGTDDGARAWQLIVKRGKDGREGPPGPRGERGEPGAAAPATAPRAARKVNGGTP